MITRGSLDTSLTINGSFQKGENRTKRNVQLQVPVYNIPIIYVCGRIQYSRRKSPLSTALGGSRVA